MNQTDRQVLDEFARRVRREFPDARIWAYGSRARGTAGPESDLDICVVAAGLDEAGDTRIRDIAWEISLDREIVICALTFSEQEFTTGPLSVSPIVASIRREGVAA